MTTQTSISTLAARVCSDLVLEVASRHGRTFIVTAFQYPDGDTLNLYLDSRRPIACLTDGGATHRKLRLDGRKMSEPRERLIGQVCATYGIEYSDGAYIRTVDAEKPGADFIRICEAITRISTIAFSREDHHKSDFKKRLETVLSTRVLHVRKWEADWHDPVVDPKSVFPIDYRFNGKHPARHLFRVSSSYKAALVAAASNLYHAHGLWVPTMCIIDPDAQLGDTDVDRLSTSSDEIVFGLDGREEKRIVEFATAGV